MRRTGVLCMKTYLAAFGRLRWHRQLFYEIVHATLDLFNLLLNAIHACFQSVHAPSIFIPAEQEFSQYPCRPLAEPCSLNRFHTISNRYDNIKVVKTYLFHLGFTLNRAMLSGICKFCIHHFLLQFALFEDVRDVTGNHRLVAPEQHCHLVLCQPDGLAISLDLKSKLCIWLINDNVLFHDSHAFLKRKYCLFSSNGSGAGDGHAGGVAVEVVLAESFREICVNRSE